MSEPTKHINGDQLSLSVKINLDKLINLML